MELDFTSEQETLRDAVRAFPPEDGLLQRALMLALAVFALTAGLWHTSRGAVVEAHESGLSIRQIAAATGISSSRVHQLLGSEESREIPRWLSQRRDQEAAPSKGHPNLRARLAGEMDALRRCREFAARLRDRAGVGCVPCLDRPASGAKEDQAVDGAGISPAG